MAKECTVSKLEFHGLGRRGENPPNPGGTIHRTTPDTDNRLSGTQTASRTPDEVAPGETAGTNRPRGRQCPLVRSAG